MEMNWSRSRREFTLFRFALYKYVYNEIHLINIYNHRQTLTVNGKTVHYDMKDNAMFNASENNKKVSSFCAKRESLREWSHSINVGPIKRLNTDLLCEIVELIYYFDERAKKKGNNNNNICGSHVATQNRIIENQRLNKYICRYFRWMHLLCVQGQNWRYRNQMIWMHLMHIPKWTKNKSKIR